MAPKKLKPKAEPKPMGRPPKQYKPEYCEMLLKHMKEGNSFNSFGALAHCSRNVLARWLEENEDFRETKKEGMELLEKFYIDLGKMMATGQLRRLKSETPLLDENNKPIYDGKTGLVLTKKEYEFVQGNSTAWIFLCKNVIGWRDKQDVELTGKDGGPVGFADLSDQQLQSKIDELVALAAKKP